MTVTKSPQRLLPNLMGGIKVFLGGGISNCADWQTKFVSMFPLEYWVNFLDPRRDDFDITNSKMSEEQIDWEDVALRSADVILFWFPPETMCPITLFELGKYVYQGTHTTRRHVVVGCDPNYTRKFDVEYQLGLDTKIKVATSLEGLKDNLCKLLSTPYFEK